MFDGRQYAQAKTTAWDRENTKPNPIWNMCHINRILVNQYRIAIAWNVILTGCLPNPKTITNTWFLWKKETTSLYSLVLSSFTETNNMDVTNRVAFSRVKWMTTDTKQSKICKNLPRFIFKVMLFFDCYTEGSGPVVHMLTSWCFFATNLQTSSQVKLGIESPHFFCEVSIRWNHQHKILWPNFCQSKQGLCIFFSSCPHHPAVWWPEKEFGRPLLVISWVITPINGLETG